MVGDVKRQRLVSFSSTIIAKRVNPRLGDELWEEIFQPESAIGSSPRSPPVAVHSMDGNNASVD